MIATGICLQSAERGIVFILGLFDTKSIKNYQMKGSSETRYFTQCHWEGYCPKFGNIEIVIS